MASAPGIVAALLGRLTGRATFDPTRRLGARGEREAAKRLRAEGYRVVRRNVRFSFGEIDLIAMDGQTVVIVEVKTRALRDRPGRPPPEESVGARKRRKLAALADAACRRYGWNERGRRIDIVAVDWPERGKPVVRHYRDAVRV